MHLKPPVAIRLVAVLQIIPLAAVVVEAEGGVKLLVAVCFARLHACFARYSG